MKSVSKLLWGGEDISRHKSPDQCGPEKQHLTGLEDPHSLSISSSAKGQSDTSTGFEFGIKHQSEYNIPLKKIANHPKDPFFL